MKKDAHEAHFVFFGSSFFNATCLITEVLDLHTNTLLISIENNFFLRERIKRKKKELVLQL